MDKHTLNILEFEKIRNEIQNYCFSVSGSQLVGRQRLSTDSEEIREIISLSVSFRSLLESGEDFPQLDFPDLAKPLDLIKVSGAVLDQAELAAVGITIISAKKLKLFILKNKSERKIAQLNQTAESLADLSVVSKEIFRYLKTNGEINEKHIPVLQSIRTQIRRLQAEIEQITAAYLKNAEYRQYWQSDKPGLKDSRTVLPLKANFKGKIKGVMHETSSSGATVYIEPFEIVEKNNRITLELNRYHQEVFKILKDLSGKVHEHYHEFNGIIETVSFLDSLYARSRFAITHQACAASLSSDNVRLHEVRHPLLGKSAVPISILMPDDIRMLVITGPNTGGKTVTLKTIGLLALINQFGTEIPAAAGSSLPVFDNIYADVGDEQSIEQSLSTFSGHIRNLGRILHRCTKRSLVLLDELGAGTDPEEGVAIAMAVLDQFIAKQCCVFSTTHHGILKNYGYTKHGVENASMSFNKETLSPSYHILMGVPGESHALAIAKHCGIPEAVLNTAREYLNKERSNISELLTNLSEKQKELYHAAETQKTKQADLNQKIRQYDLKILQLRQKEADLRAAGIRELSNFLAQARKELTRLVADLKSSGLSKAQTKDVQTFLDNIKEKLITERSDFEAYDITVSDNFTPRAGMEVLLLPSRERAKILRQDKKGLWLVATETLKISVTREQMQPFKVPSEDNSFTVITSGIEFEPAALTLDLRGYRLETALANLEKQIDNAILNGLKEFSIIHGKGEGILRQGIQDYLQKRKEVENFSFAHPDQGGYGKTNVRLKS